MRSARLTLERRATGSVWRRARGTTKSGRAAVAPTNTPVESRWTQSNTSPPGSQNRLAAKGRTPRETARLRPLRGIASSAAKERNVRMKPTQELFDSARSLHAGRIEAYRRGELQASE